MEKKIKYSVIIPIYNAEKTLARCLKSLVMQGRTDAEIVLINDGSSDHSERIILDFKVKYPESGIVYVYQPNGGVSKARNKGLELARGTYITFVDSDDCVTSDYFEVLDTFGDNDLCVFGSSNMGAESDDAEILEAVKNAERFSEKLNLLVSSRKIMSPCNKRFAKHIIDRHSLRFTEKFAIGEDFDFCLSYALHCETIQAVSNSIYQVDISDLTSLSRKYRPHLDDKMCGVFAHIEQSVQNSPAEKIDQAELLAVLDYLFIKNVFSCIAEEFKCGKPHYFKEREKFRAICKKFERRIGGQSRYCGAVHRVLRLMLQCGWYYPLYAAAYLAKRNAFRKYSGE